MKVAIRLRVATKTLAEAVSFIEKVKLLADLRDFGIDMDEGHNEMVVAPRAWTAVTHAPFIEAAEEIAVAVPSKGAQALQDAQEAAEAAPEPVTAPERAPAEPKPVLSLQERLSIFARQQGFPAAHALLAGLPPAKAGVVPRRMSDLSAEGLAALDVALQDVAE